MKVSTTQPFRIIYSLYEHQYLGFLFEPFVVQVNSKMELTLQYQTISSKNVQEFSQQLDHIDIELVHLTDKIHQDSILKKFNLKKIPVYDFFNKIFHETKGDKLLQEAILAYVEGIRIQILERCLSKTLFIMGGDGNPLWQSIDVQQNKSKIHFHFIRNEDFSTNYFPIIRHQGERVAFQHRKTKVICDELAWLLVENKLYHFEKEVDGKKLKPFINKSHIVIPANLEDTYYRKYIANLVASFDVFAKGFEIKYENQPAVPVLQISEMIPSESINFLQKNESESSSDNQNDSKIIIDLYFNYNVHNFKFDSFAAEANVIVEKTADSWIFNKIKRNLKIEREKINFLKNTGLEIKSGRAVLKKSDAFSWLQKNRKSIEDESFILKQLNGSNKQYFLGYSTIEVKINEKQDWFDIHAVVIFGEFEIEFFKLRDLILAKKREFILPNGQIAIIPEEWLIQYKDLFDFSEKVDNEVVLRKHHLALVQDLSAEGLAHAIMNSKLQNLKDFATIEDKPLPASFIGELRPYQKAGFNWMHFLNDYKLGGCLADDMGLGKTIQTLAFIASLKEKKSQNPTLIVMPTSLTYNWIKEAEKFVPSLKIYLYTGTNREKETTIFNHFDLIITSYGIVRMDIDLIKFYRFDYVILDESQSIKNPASIATKAVNQLNSGNRLILTGTPLENSTIDLWSQMTFLNPGLLGTQAYFKNEFQIPIEKNQDENKTKKLFSLIKPFMMRRHKSQVAKELPEKVENLHYSEMTEAQEKYYEETKSYFRNLIFDSIENTGVSKSQLIVLQGLTKLRQIANHPFLIDKDYADDSGKFKDINHKLDTILESGNKVLVFSQFVKHLSIFKNKLIEKNIDFCYLDGTTSSIERQNEVERFQNDDSVKIFLMSLKAGGLGLNLTAAEYVFILDPWWNPAIEAQAVDRAHRIGQKNTVFTYKFITRNTVEEKILRLQKNKKRLFDDLITTEETFVKALTKEDIMSLLE